MTHYDPELTDEEWREANFGNDVILSAAQLGKVASPTKLIEYARKYGTDGVLESAIMLGQDSYRAVEQALFPKQRRRRAAA